MIAQLQKKIYRLRLGRRFKHRATADPRFSLKIDTQDPLGGAMEILWRGKVVAKTQPYSALPVLKSKDIFLIATGPSLAELNLELLENRIVFGVNGAIALRSAHFRFQYHMVTDPDFFEHRTNMIQKMVESDASCFFSFQGLSVLCKKDPTLLHEGHIYLTEILNRRFHFPQLKADVFDRVANEDSDLLLHSKIHGQEGRIGFSKRLDRGLFSGKTVIYRAIQAAYWLGFHRVYILGMDLGYTGQHSRFYETHEKGRPSKLDKDYVHYIEPCFEILHQFVQNQQQFQVFNLSPISRLPERLMPRISFEQAIQETNIQGPSS